MTDFLSEIINSVGTEFFSETDQRSLSLNDYIIDSENTKQIFPDFDHITVI